MQLCFSEKVRSPKYWTKFRITPVALEGCLSYDTPNFYKFQETFPRKHEKLNHLQVLKESRSGIQVLKLWLQQLELMSHERT